MDPGVPQNALIQVSHTLGRLVLRFRLQHLSTPQDLRRGGASWGRGLGGCLSRRRGESWRPRT